MRAGTQGEAQLVHPHCSSKQTCTPPLPSTALPSTALHHPKKTSLLLLLLLCTESVSSAALSCVSQQRNTPRCVRLTDNEIKITHTHTRANSQSNLLLDRFQNLSRVLRGGSAAQPVVAYFQVSGGFSRFNLSVCAFTSVRRNSTPPEGGNVIRAAAVIALNNPSLTVTPQDPNGGQWCRLVAVLLPPSAGEPGRPGPDGGLKVAPQD